MITEKELAEYRSLCSTLDSLHEVFLKRKQELRKLLEETAARKREAFLVLARANGLTRHLNDHQRNTIGLSYRIGDIKNRINQVSPVLFRNSIEDTELKNSIQALMPREDYSLRTEAGRRELKQMALAVVSLIDRIKKHILQLDILELRCRELISSMKKAMEAFRYEERIIRGKIYPFGIFSILRRSARSLVGAPYFFSRDMNHVAALGNMTGLVLKIADSPLL